MEPKNMTFELDGKAIGVVFVNIGDMSSRWSIFQIGGANSDYPLITLPLHKDQQGDVFLNPSGLCRRYAIQSWSWNSLGDLPQTQPGRPWPLPRYRRISLKPNLAGHDPCLDIGGCGHMHKNIFLRFSFCLLIMSWQFGTQNQVSQLLFHKLLTIEKYETKAPQFTGTQCREISRTFDNILKNLKGSAVQRNTLRSIQHSLFRLGIIWEWWNYSIIFLLDHSLLPCSVGWCVWVSTLCPITFRNDFLCSFCASKSGGAVWTEWDPFKDQGFYWMGKRGSKLKSQQGFASQQQ